MLGKEIVRENELCLTTLGLSDILAECERVDLGRAIPTHSSLSALTATGISSDGFDWLLPITLQEELLSFAEKLSSQNGQLTLSSLVRQTCPQLLGGKSSLKQRISVERCGLKWAQQLVTKHHYLHRPIHPRSLPFAYSISLDDEIVGTIIMATPHFTKKKGLFGYDGLPTKWQVLQIARLWIDPKYQHPQSNGHASNIASCAIAKVLKRVNDDWLEHHPPKYLDQPFNIELVISYADTSVGHQGTIYRAANFQRWGETTNNRPRHGLSKGSKEPKILYIYRFKQKSKSSIKNSKVLLGGDKNSPIQEDKKRPSPSQEISIPCLIKQPKQPELKGVIKQDLGDRFVVYIPSDDSTVTVSKLLVYPDFPESKSSGQIEKNPSQKLHPSKNNPRKRCDPADSQSAKERAPRNRRKKGEGNGSIHYRTVTKNGKEYTDAYYHYVENGQKKTKYIPKTLLNKVQEAESSKLPVSDILFLLGGDKKNPRKSSNTSLTSVDEKLNDSCVEQDNLNPRKSIPPSTRKRKQGCGTGYIECKPIQRSGKEYQQYWYHYEEWRQGDRLTKKSRYIPKRLLARIEKLEAEKVAVRKILEVLGVKR
ncbi:hypothetical protein Sta7437_4854 (plasmid) [Stanieria cyanosphaera PCC 7437]|uniref:Uncharacterized protein n=1 Tax=Stanieria cyanosphaera (strain ATCC 29371 / PCC 7437) TaxID=111780 RepID=K9Y1K2_STAC7|nr:hypothetical protein [Stanieria cyanosphaera]AFZ38286.1 hypothetical protein Sta7437_4854 [Stanieria cyanosphaera PCC 7437]